MKLTNRIKQRMDVLRSLIQTHEEEFAKLKDKHTYWGGRESGVIFGYQQELNHLKILLQEVTDEPQRASVATGA